MDHGYSEAGSHDKPPHEHRKHRHNHHSQRRADPEGGDGLVLEQPWSPISSVSDRPKSPFPHPSPTNEEHFFHVSSFSEPFSCRSQSDQGCGASFGSFPFFGPDFNSHQALNETC